MIKQPDLARVILETGIFEFQPRRLTDGSESKFYFNFRTPPKGRLTDGLIRQLGVALWVLADQNDLSYFGAVGVPNAGIPFAHAVGRFARVPVFELWKREGEKRAIVAPPSLRHQLPRGPVLLCDDVVTSGRSKIEAVRAIREDAGGLVGHIVALVDREQGGREALAREAIQFHSVWRASELFKFWREAGLINQKRYEEITANPTAA